MAISDVVTERSSAHATARTGSLRTQSDATLLLANVEQRPALRRSYHAYCLTAPSSLETTALEPECPPTLLPRR